MNMKTIQLCRQCGKPLPPDALLGLCPECLMKAGMPVPKSTIAVAPNAFVESAETETKEFVAGTRLGYIGDYELLEEIARGGMGVVYKARQSSLKRIVAVKMIRSGEQAGEKEIKRFHTEAEAAAQLQHPGIVAIHEIGEHEGRHYFSMDFVDGKNLAQIGNGKPISPRSAAEWLKAITEAVQYAHQRGVLHRDLKPQNIMLDAAGRPRVTDFGLAKNLGSDSTLTNTGAVMGSPCYMSPEQARGRNDLIGPATDVYSLGAILYELLTGQPPFRGKTPIETMSQVVNDDPPRPRSLNPNAAVDLETICLKCLEKDPVRRYPTARELEADLGRFLEGEPVQAQPANAFRRTVSWFRRHRWVLSAAVSALILTLAGLAFGLWEQTRFIIWLNAHPGFAKAPAQRVPGLDLSSPSLGVFAAMLVGAAAGALVRLVFKTLPPAKKLRSLLAQPRAPGVATAFEAVGFLWNLLLIAVALFLVGDSIHRFVWTGQLPGWFGISLVILVFHTGVTGLMRMVREQLRIPIEPRPEAKPEPLSPMELAPIHEAIFTGRTNDAFKLYHAARGAKPNQKVVDMFDLRNMEAELKQAHPEKFSAAVLHRRKIDRAFGYWLGLGVLLLVGLLILTGVPILACYWVLMGSWFGAVIRLMSSNKMAGWKEAYRGMRPGIRFLAWVLVAFFVFATGLGAWHIFGLIAHPSGATFKELGLGLLVPCVPAVGWLVVHIWIKKRKAP
jgi:tRNA A-37 threonylcarbamoyl transferase component Bud32